MRISERHRYDLAGGRIERAKSNNADALDQISTQKRILKLSDDPLAAAQAIRQKDKISSSEQYQKNIMFSKGFMERTEASISGIHDKLIRAKELAIGMSNDTYDANSREAASREIKQIIEEVTSLANTTYNNRFVLAGFRTQTPSISGDGAYTGDDGVIFMQIGKDDFRQINLQARHLFEPSVDEKANRHFNLMDTLDILHRGLSGNDKQMIHTSLEELDFQMDKASSYQATIGALQSSLDQATHRLEFEQEDAQATLSRLEDADIYKGSSDFKRTETVLQATLMASNKLVQPSLMNFMQ